VFFDKDEAGLPAVEIGGNSRSGKAGSRPDKGDDRSARKKQNEDAVQIIFPKDMSLSRHPASLLISITGMWWCPTGPGKIWRHP
jgi:hypothetical protein